MCFTMTNLTYVTLSGFVELEKYRYLYFLLTLIVYILIVCSNSLIVCLIGIHKSLHQPMYVFIAALLINSLLFSTNIFPKLFFDVLSDKQQISYPACLTQAFIFYSLSASEFLLLAAMAYDRYVSICKPLRYANIMSGQKVSAFLLSAWILPFCQIFVTILNNSISKLCSWTLKAVFCNNAVNELLCVVSQPLMVYGLVVLVTTAFCPVLFILFTYARILLQTFRSCKEVRRKAAHTCLPHLLVLMNYLCLMTYDMLLVRLESKLPKAARFVLTMQMITFNPLINPIIYGLKMKEINKRIQSLLAQIKPL